jgi:hypothetical protein
MHLGRPLIAEQEPVVSIATNISPADLNLSSHRPLVRSAEALQEIAQHVTEKLAGLASSSTSNEEDVDDLRSLALRSAELLTVIADKTVSYAKQHDQLLMELQEESCRHKRFRAEVSGACADVAATRLIALRHIVHDIAVADCGSATEAEALHAVRQLSKRVDVLECILGGLLQKQDGANGQGAIRVPPIDELSAEFLRHLHKKLQESERRQEELHSELLFLRRLLGGHVSAAENTHECESGAEFLWKRLICRWIDRCSSLAELLVTESAQSLSVASQAHQSSPMFAAQIALLSAHSKLQSRTLCELMVRNEILGRRVADFQELRSLLVHGAFSANELQCQQLGVVLDRIQRECSDVTASTRSTEEAHNALVAEFVHRCESCVETLATMLSQRETVYLERMAALCSAVQAASQCIHALCGEPCTNVEAMSSEAVQVSWSGFTTKLTIETLPTNLLHELESRMAEWSRLYTESVERLANQLQEEKSRVESRVKWYQSRDGTGALEELERALAENQRLNLRLEKEMEVSSARARIEEHVVQLRHELSEKTKAVDASEREIRQLRVDIEKFGKIKKMKDVLIEKLESRIRQLTHEHRVSESVSHSGLSSAVPGATEMPSNMAMNESDSNAKVTLDDPLVAEDDPIAEREHENAPESDEVDPFA